VPGYVPINGNEVVQGNVSGLKYFHGTNVGTSSEYQFQGNLGSSSLNSFARKTSGNDVNSSTLNQVYYLPSATVSTSQGRLYSAPIGGGFDSMLVPRQSVSPVASSTQINSLMPANQSGPIRAFNRMDQSAPIEAGTPGALMSSPLFALRASELTPESAQAAAADNSTSTKDKSSKTGASDNADNTDNADSPDSKNDRGQAKPIAAIDARVRGRTDDGRLATTAMKSDQRIGDTYRSLLEDLNKAQGEADNNGPDTGSSATNGSQGQGTGVSRGNAEAKGSNVLSEIDPLTGQPRKISLAGRGASQGRGTSAAAGRGTVEAALTPKRLEDMSDNVLQAGSKVKPVNIAPQIGSGMVPTPFDTLMAQGEQLMKDGKYFEAAQMYDTALTTRPADSLAVVAGRTRNLAPGCTRVRHMT